MPRANQPVRKSLRQGHYPFGDLWYPSTALTKEVFTTYERDAESGNDYAMARYNVNRLGRFSSVDPLSGSIGNPQSLNHYSYSENDPINLADPSGMSDAKAIGETGKTCGLDGIQVDCGWIFRGAQGIAGDGGSGGEAFTQCQTATCGGFLQSSNGQSLIFYEQSVLGSENASTTFNYPTVNNDYLPYLPNGGDPYAASDPTFSPQGGGGSGGGGGGTPFDVKKFICNASAIQVMNDMFQAVGDGRARSEAAVSILQTGDNFNFTKMTISNQDDAIIPFPQGWSATIHTHRNGGTPWPSEQDIKASGPAPNGVNVPFLVLSSGGLYMTDPSQKSGYSQVLSGMAWQNNKHCK